jgi:hypothetical protein
MTKIPNCKTIVQSVGTLFECRKKENFTELHTPFLYPDGGVISLFLEKSKDGHLTVTDGGETMRWYRTQTLAEKRSDTQNRKIQSICDYLDVAFFHGELRVIMNGKEDLPDVIMRVAQAAMRVSGIGGFTKSRMSAESIQDKVSVLFDKHKIKYRRNCRETGQSGKRWGIDFGVFAQSKEVFVNVLQTANRTNLNKDVEHVFTCFSDLIPRRGKNLLFSLLCDNGESDDASVKLLSNVSQITDLDNFEQKFKSAA